MKRAHRRDGVGRETAMLSIQSAIAMLFLINMGILCSAANAFGRKSVRSVDPNLNTLLVRWVTVSAAFDTLVSAVRQILVLDFLKRLG